MAKKTKKSRKLNKKGQEIPSGSAAAVVVGAITVLLLFYIVFLPPAERADLLGTGDGTNGGPNGIASITLYEKAIGSLDYSGARYYDHSISSIFLSETTNTKTIKAYSPFTIRNGWFSKLSKTLEFSLNELNNIDFVRLAFDAQKYDGSLRLSLNGKIIYENKINTFTVAPIELDKTLLKKDNKLKIEVSGVGLAFWKTNEFSLINPKIIADITDKSRQEGQNIVIIREEEKNNLESAYLQFDPICTQNKVGPLTIYFNNQEIYFAIPDCNTINRIDLKPTDIAQGMNTLRFRTSEGNYRLETMKIRAYQKKGKDFLDYFTISKEEFSKVENSDVFIKIRFVDDGQDKTAQLNINGKYKYIDQKEPEFESKINRFLEDGNNYIRIEPKTSFEIVDVKIYTE